MMNAKTYKVCFAVSSGGQFEFWNNPLGSLLYIYILEIILPLIPVLDHSILLPFLPQSSQWNMTIFKRYLRTIGHTPTFHFHLEIHPFFFGCHDYGRKGMKIPLFEATFDLRFFGIASCQGGRDLIVKQLPRCGKLGWKNFQCLGKGWQKIQSSLQQKGWLPFLPESWETNKKHEIFKETNLGLIHPCSTEPWLWEEEYEMCEGPFWLQWWLNSPLLNEDCRDV